MVTTSGCCLSVIPLSPPSTDEEAEVIQLAGRGLWGAQEAQVQCLDLTSMLRQGVEVR